MADSFPSRPMPPSDWAQAFASLPMAAPPADAWSRIATSLPGAAPRRRHAATGWAIAATLAVVTGGAWLVMSASREAPQVIAQQDSAGATISRSTHREAATTADQSTPTNTSNKSVDALPVTQAAAGPAVAMHEHATATATASAISSTSPRSASRTAAPPSAIERTVATVPATESATMTVSTATSLDDLRAESARLEALVAYARDERMQSAAAAMLTGDVDDRLHVIDAALSQTGLANSERLDLWSKRVAALRELAGLEGTQRWLVAHGESYEDALARVD